MIVGLDSYKEAYGVESDSAIKPGLESMERAMELLGYPNKALTCIHVAGTNGKGSTVTFLKEMALKHGLTVGTFMSPGIIDVHDQIQVNGQNITKEELGAVFEELKNASISGLCTDFELLTCAMLVHFRNKKVDVAVIEAGMGGRFDSTNVIDGKIAVIPSIALEHTNFLGNSLVEIAHHKAGIIKTGSVAVVGQVDDEVYDVIVREAVKVGAQTYRMNVDYPCSLPQIIELLRFETKDIQLKMLGEHQQKNAALATISFIKYCEKQGIEWNEAAIASALSNAQLAFRFEEVLPNVFFDGAHNPASVNALVDLIDKHFSDRKVELMIGMLKDKDVEQVLELLEPIVTKISFLNVPNERALAAEEFYAKSYHPNKEIVWENPLEELLKPVSDDTIRVVTGSLYLLSDLRTKLINMTK